MAQEVKKGNFLDHLTKGLCDAVVQANALAENQHIESLSKFINEDGTPKEMKWVINGEDVNVPLQTLAPQNSIKMSEVKMKLKVKLNNFGKRKSRLGGGIFKKEDAGAVSADLGSSILPCRNNYADLEITFKSTDPPEGLIRLNNHLIKQLP
jgi:hypothetical protein|tara:strand:- start:3681 stop:4136 length:456 start_codon:yes stop_codon:yes gene_type:complete